MKCNSYRNALLEAAAGNVKGRILAHVEECSQCRAALSREQALFDSIDKTLRDRMADMPRDGFLADVRARISQEPEPRSLMNPIWILATASVMVATLAMVTWTRLRHEPVVVSSTLSTTHASPEVKVAAPNTTEMPHRRQGKQQIVAQTVALEPEVLVPPDEREALARFITHLRAQDEVVVAFASPAPTEKSEPTEIPPLEISRIQFKPLVWERWRPAEDQHGQEER
jgi:hypothetical protein